MTIKLTQTEILDILKTHIRTLTTQELPYDGEVVLLIDGTLNYANITAKIEFFTGQIMEFKEQTSDQMNKLIDKYNHKLARLEKQLKDNYKDISYTLTPDGKWSQGYLTGKISEIENTINELEALNKVVI